MDEIEKFARIDAILCHQSGQRRPMFLKILLLDPPRLHRAATEQLPNKAAHAQIDEFEKVGRRRIETVVQVEDPAVDMVKGRGHRYRLTRRFRFSKEKARVPYKLLRHSSFCGVPMAGQLTKKTLMFSACALALTLGGCGGG